MHRNGLGYQQKGSDVLATNRDHGQSPLVVKNIGTFILSVTTSAAILVRRLYNGHRRSFVSRKPTGES